MQTTARKIYQTIKNAKHILLIPHQNPDGDALGTVAACSQFLRRIDKPHMIFCATPASDRLAYLPHADYIVTDPTLWTRETFDLIIVFDSGDLRYAGVADHIERLAKKPTIINIDHHATNEHYGDINMVMTKASSTAEVLYRFFTYSDIAIDAHTATCLLTGLMTDTDQFTNGATSPGSLSIASDLIAKGGDVRLIRGNMFRNKSIAALKLWGVALARLSYLGTTPSIAYTYIMQDDLREHAVGEVEIEGIANFLNNLHTEDAHASLVLKELSDGKLKGSFRTTRDDLDVSAFAKALGGGGHKKAAGFTVNGPLTQARDAIFKVVTSIVKTPLPTV